MDINNNNWLFLFSPNVIISRKVNFLLVTTNLYRVASHRSSLLIQLSSRTSADRAGCGADLAGCVSVAGFFLRPQGAFPPGYYSLGGVSPSAWGAPNKGNADGAVGILGKCRARVDYGPAPGPIKKGLVPHFHVRWGVEQIPHFGRPAVLGAARIWPGASR